jgi:hypothetical protein
MSINIPSQTPLFYAIQKDRYYRQNLINDIESTTNRKLISYIASFDHPGGSIEKTDVLGFGDLLHGMKSEDVDLLLNSPGGDIDVAEKLVYMCWSRASSVRVIVPESAKSAATLIALAANRVVMSDTSELGPIDPQIVIATPSGEPIIRPASSFLDGLDDIKAEAAKTGSLSPAYFPLLAQLDPALIDFCRKAITRSQRFAQKWLLKTQCQGHPTKAKKIAKSLVSTKRYLSHGTVIDHNEAESIGLAVEYLAPDDALWQAIWRLYCAYEVDIRKDSLAKIFESAAVSIPMTW